MLCLEEEDSDVVQLYLVDMPGGEAVLEVPRLPHHAVPLDLLLQALQSLQDPAGQAREMNQLPFLQVAEQINRVLGDF